MYVILKRVGEKSIQLQVADTNTGHSRYISPEACIGLLNSSGQTIQIRSHIPADHPEKWAAREALVGSWDQRTGTLTVGVGAVGKPITSPKDIVSKEAYQLPPELFESFARVFDATLRDADAVALLAKRSRQKQVNVVNIAL